MTGREQRNDDPFRINLEQQKKRSKDLLKALKTSDPMALARFRKHHPKARNLTEPAIASDLARLADAQLVIAREFGLSSWPALKAHIAGMETSLAAMETMAAAPDKDLTTLHIRCGSDLKEALKVAGFAGDFFEYADPVCQGPVVDDGDLLVRRAGFLARAYGRQMEFTEAESLARLRNEEADLAAAAKRYERVVLWFEHDSYDQLILARCLAHFAGNGAPQMLELVTVDRFPGSARFIGLGQLPPEALRLLWAKRQPVTRSQRDLGARVWQALQSPDPTALLEVARSASTTLPQMAGAIRRHVRELPSTVNGTALTEHLALECLKDGPMPMGRMFRDLMLEKDPLPWLGDLMFFHILEEMLLRAEQPALEVDPATMEEEWPRRVVTLTDMGRAVLAGEQDYLSLGPPERWVGGVRIAPGHPCWRWDEAEGRPVWR